MRRVLLPLCLALMFSLGGLAGSLVRAEPTTRPPLKARLTDAVVTTTSSTSTTSSTTTTSTTEPPTTTTAAYVRHTVQQPASRSAPQPRPSGTVAASAKPPHHSGYATSCMDNAAHTAALAHACWDDLLAQYPWSTSRAFSVLMCESEGNPWDYNSSSATGLMQELGGPYDPASNIAVAYDMFSHRGWQPWQQSQSCWASAQKG